MPVSFPPLHFIKSPVSPTQSLPQYKAAPTLPGAPRAWGVVQAATLYLAARQAGLGLVIPEVAAAMATNIWVVGASYRCVS